MNYYSITNNNSLNSTGELFFTKILTTFPDLGALIGLNTFIASINNKVSPSFTVDPISTNGAESGVGRGINNTHHW